MVITISYDLSKEEEEQAYAQALNAEHYYLALYAIKKALSAGKRSDMVAEIRRVLENCNI